MSKQKESEYLDDDELKNMDDNAFSDLNDKPFGDAEEAEEDIEEDFMELDEIEAKLESGEAFFLPTNESSLLPRVRVIYQCPRCHRVFFNNKWVKDKITDIFTIRTELAYCDRCLNKAVENFVGSIEIYDKKLRERKDQHIATARQVEQELENSPPFEKIINIAEKNEILFIFANTTRLAMEIGRRLREEFHGGIQYEWFERNQYLRVKWFDEIHNRDYFKERIRALKERRFGLFAFEDED